MIQWFLLFFLSSPSHAGTEIFAKAQDLVQKGKTAAAVTLLQDEQKKDIKDDEKRLLQFNTAYLIFQQNKYEEAAGLFKDFLATKSNLEEYAHYYLGRSYLKLQKKAEAEKELQEVLSLSPNLKLRIETSILLGQIAIDAKNYKQAKNFIYRLEKRTRGSEQYPEIIYAMARIEKGLRNHATSCRWIKKLYSRYPGYEKVSSWGADLFTNEMDGKPTDCRSTPEEFRTRIRNLMWAGLDQKAQAEITGVRERLAKTDKYGADQLQAQFYLQEGEVVKAMELLKPYYESMKRNFNYLMLFASASARAGEVQLAVGSYYSAYKLSPRSKLGRQALYQSAFLSYQFQDYDGAARRFQEFMKVYPTSGLNRDAKWHLAWLKYLKGDYEGAYKDFAKMQIQKKRYHRKWQSFPSDRVTYWMAMSRYRMGEYEQAKSLFESLAKDPLIGYYSVAAQARLKKMLAMRAEDLKTTPKSNFVAPRAPSRFTSNDFLMPSVEEELSATEETESEETLIANQYEDPSAEESSEDMADDAGDDNPDIKSVGVAQNGEAAEADENGEERPSPFANPKLTKKFEQARDLVIVGLGEWARWDLYEIESKTTNKEYLKSLMAEYTGVGHYHRASYIAQTSFGPQRAAKGIDGVRYLWEYAYPKAYSDSVDKYTKKFEVPSELVWGIMRAESHYRRDAISPVGALGLMQVMPFTGHKVATLIGDGNFTAPKLLEPETAVKIGSRYLKRLMDTFQNAIPLAAAGYNAGPHRVKSWLANFGTLDTDEFIEHIPFLETRNYVKKVMSNCEVYSILYGNKKELFPYLSEPVPAKFMQENVVKENWDDI